MKIRIDGLKSLLAAGIMMAVIGLIVMIATLTPILPVTRTLIWSGPVMAIAMLAAGIGVASLAYLREHRLEKEVNRLRDRIRMLGTEYYPAEDSESPAIDTALLQTALDGYHAELLDERIRMERRIADLEERLMRFALGAERSDQDLREKKILLEESNRQLESMYYVISHHLKEPMRSIEAFTSFIIEDYTAEMEGEAVEYLQGIRKNCILLRELVDDLVTVADIANWNDSLHPVDLGKIVMEIREFLNASRYGGSARVLVKGVLPRICGNEIKLRQLFLNLIENGIKFNKNPQPEVEVSCVKNSTREYTFRIRDNGIGIPLHHQDTIFTLFHRLHPREDYDGTGAGLAICQRIVELHGGRIWLESNEGEGSSFYFTMRDLVS